ncbi:PfkB family carbohydrate kinase [Microbacterium sp. ZW T5_56]|uniref:PfkB family carbohydrate kinase n=1 Tax=Microbacterium sp. ZW T5_56 TaxID=3378081 RepID=UPI0038536847
MTSTKQPGRLVYAGSVIVDIGVAVPAVPRTGTEVLATHAEITAGGGANTLIAAARDGAATVYAGRYGSGPFGTIVADTLHSIDCATPIPAAERDSGYCIVMVDDTAERTFITVDGAEADVSLRELAAIPMRDQDLVAVTGYVLTPATSAETVPAWLESLPSARVLLDPAPVFATVRAEVRRRVLARTDVLTANAAEARELTEAGDDVPLAEVATRLRKLLRPDAVVLVRDGGSGCWIADSTGTRAVAGFPQHAVDTTGAGDTHLGVLCAALLRGDSIDASARRANAAAAISVTRRGPATSPDAQETDALLAAHGVDLPRVSPSDGSQAEPSSADDRSPQSMDPANRAAAATRTEHAG